MGRVVLFFFAHCVLHTGVYFIIHIWIKWITRRADKKNVRNEKGPRRQVQAMCAELRPPTLNWIEKWKLNTENRKLNPNRTEPNRMKAKRFLEKPSTKFRLCDLRKILEPRFNVSGLLSVWLEYFMSVVYFPLANLKRFRSLSDSIISFFFPSCAFRRRDNSIQFISAWVGFGADLF